MFVGVARLSLHIGESGSLKGKRAVLRKVIERVKARFNASIAEVEDQDLWQKATIALAVVGGDQRHVNEQLEKIIRFVDEMYLAPLLSREIEILSFNEQLYQHQTAEVPPELLTIPKGDRSLAEAEGMGAWEERFEEKPKKAKAAQAHPAGGSELSLEERRQKARRLRNPRDWEHE